MSSAALAIELPPELATLPPATQASLRALWPAVVLQLSRSPRRTDPGTVALVIAPDSSGPLQAAYVLPKKAAQALALFDQDLTAVQAVLAGPPGPGRRRLVAFLPCQCDPPHAGNVDLVALEVSQHNLQLSCLAPGGSA